MELITSSCMFSTGFLFLTLTVSLALDGELTGNPATSRPLNMRFTYVSSFVAVMIGSGWFSGKCQLSVSKSSCSSKLFLQIEAEGGNEKQTTADSTTRFNASVWADSSLWENHRPRAVVPALLAALRRFSARRAVDKGIWNNPNTLGCYLAGWIKDVSDGFI